MHTYLDLSRKPGVSFFFSPVHVFSWLRGDSMTAREPVSDSQLVPLTCRVFILSCQVYDQDVSVFRLQLHCMVFSIHTWLLLFFSLTRKTFAPLITKNYKTALLTQLIGIGHDFLFNGIKLDRFPEITKTNIFLLSSSRMGSRIIVSIKQKQIKHCRERVRNCSFTIKLRKN